MMDSFYYNDYLFNPGISILSIIFLIFITFICIGSLISYIFSSYYLMKIAQKENIQYAWLAWIPIGNLYILGKISGPFDFIVPIKNPELVLVIASAINVVLVIIPILGSLFSLALIILQFATIYFIYKKYKGEKASIMLVLTILFSIITYPIYLHSIYKDFNKISNVNEEDFI